MLAHVLQDAAPRTMPGISSSIQYAGAGAPTRRNSGPFAALETARFGIPGHTRARSTAGRSVLAVATANDCGTRPQAQRPISRRNAQISAKALRFRLFSDLVFCIHR